MSYGDQLHTKNVTEELKSTDIFWVLRKGSVVPVKGLRFDDLIFSDPPVFDSDLQVNGYVNLQHIAGNIYDCSTTETVDVSTYTNIHVSVSGITLSLTGMLSDSFITIKNLSDGDIYLNINILFAGTTVTAPITMPSGDSYPLIYDLDNTRFIL